MRLWLVRRAATAKAREEWAELFLSREELALLQAERALLQSWALLGPIGAVKTGLYNVFLHPLKELKAAINRQGYLPPWNNYIVYVMCLALAAFCSYYTFQFSVS